MHKFCNRDNHESSSLITHIHFDPYQSSYSWSKRGGYVYKAPTLDCLMQWITDESDAAITSAIYSSDGEIIYVGLRSEFIKVLDSKTSLTICRINLIAFSQSIPSNIRLEAYPTVVVAHPSYPNQISVGFSNDKVIVFQPLVRGGWGESASLEDDGDYYDGSDHC